MMEEDYSGLEGFSGAGSFEIVSTKRKGNPTASGNGGGSSIVTDPFFSNVKLLLGFEGVNGSTGAPGMTDGSSALHGTATVNGGTCAISTTQKKFGTSSIFFGGSGPQDLIYFPDSDDWNLAAGNFTIECFSDPITLGAGFKNLVSQWGSSGFGWALWLNGDQLTWVVSTTGANVLIDMASASSIITAGSQFHVCVDFDGIKYRMYIGGTMVASSTTLRTIFDSSNKLSIGGDFEQLLKFYNGYTDEIRITKGVARYASDAGYSVPTAAFPRS